MTGADLIACERKQQMLREGYTSQDDDEHIRGEIALAAAAYALHSVPHVGWGRLWPWGPFLWKPTTRIRDLVKAGALIAAEIDRLQRLEGS